MSWSMSWHAKDNNKRNIQEERNKYKIKPFEHPNERKERDYPERIDGSLLCLCMLKLPQFVSCWCHQFLPFGSRNEQIVGNEAEILLSPSSEILAQKKWTGIRKAGNNPVSARKGFYPIVRKAWKLRLHISMFFVHFFFRRRETRISEKKPLPLCYLSFAKQQIF